MFRMDGGGWHWGWDLAWDGGGSLPNECQMKAWQRDDEDLWDEVPGYEDLCDDEDLWQILAWDEDLWAMLVPSGAPVNTYFEALGPVLGLLWGPLGHLSGPS